MSAGLDPENWDSVRALGHRMFDDMLDWLQSARDAAGLGTDAGRKACRTARAIARRKALASKASTPIFNG